MEAKRYFLIYVMMVLLSSSFYIHAKPLPKFSKSQIDKGISEQKSQRNLQSEEEDSYIVLHYGKETTYTNGFKNDYRKNISFILLRTDNSKLTDEDELNIPAGSEIEIHFNSSVNNIENFFSQSIDENMANVVSIDFSNFNSSSVTNMNSLFSNCVSLESVDLTNFTTSSVTTMSNMFSNCS